MTISDWLRQPGRVHLPDPSRILWVAAERDYVRYHAPTRTFLVRKTLTAAARELAPDRFVRIHRSTLVNLDHIAELRPVRGGDCRVILREGTVLTLSRTFRRKLSSPQCPSSCGADFQSAGDL